MSGCAEADETALPPDENAHESAAWRGTEMLPAPFDASWRGYRCSGNRQSGEIDPVVGKRKRGIVAKKPIMLVRRVRPTDPNCRRSADFTIARIA